MTRSVALVKPIPALAVGIAGVIVVTVALLPFRNEITRAEPALLLMVPVIVAGILGGRFVAGAVALLAAFAFASGFLPPLGSPKVELAADVVALALFIVVAGVAGVLVASVVTSERRQLAAEGERNDALEEVDRQRAALLQSVSHDLRTPLATIRAVSIDLQDDVPFRPEVRHELLGLVVGEAERLDRIVANLLSMSRIEIGSFRPDRQAVDVAELIEACCARLDRVLRMTRLEVLVEPDMPLVDLDYVQFDQVLTNLLENAARLTPPGGLVRVEAAAGPPFTLSVSDDGPGFSADMLDRAFVPFTSSSGGRTNGVGLSVCRSIVVAHGGTITATNRNERGARVTIEVPDVD